MWQEGQGPGNLAVLQALENIENKFQRSFTSLLSLKKPTFKETSTPSRHSHWAAKDRPFWGNYLSLHTPAWVEGFCKPALAS